MNDPFAFLPRHMMIRVHDGRYVVIAYKHTNNMIDIAGDAMSFEDKDRMVKWFTLTYPEEITIIYEYSQIEEHLSQDGKDNVLNSGITR